MFAALLGILLSCAPAAHAAFDGGRSDGGADPFKADAAYLRLLLENGSLKRALGNYLDSIALDSVRDDAVRETLRRAMANGELRRDIETADNYKIEPSCSDLADSNVAAAAHIGDRGGPICFDVERLGASYRELSREEGMIRLAALALHEHIHHFQSPQTAMAENEREAYRVGAYVELTAKVVQEPLLKWDPNRKVRGNRGPDEDKVHIELPEVKVVICKGVEIKDSGIAEEHTVKVRMGKGVSYGRHYDATTDIDNQGRLITTVTRFENDYTFRFANMGNFLLELHPGYAGATACEGDHWIGIEKWVPPLTRRPVNAPDCKNGMGRYYNQERWAGKLTITDDPYNGHGAAMMCTVEFQD